MPCHRHRDHVEEAKDEVIMLCGKRWHVLGAMMNRRREMVFGQRRAPVSRKMQDFAWQPRCNVVLIQNTTSDDPSHNGSSLIATRLRSSSVASTTSSLSVDSPGPSSSNASTTSLHLSAGAKIHSDPDSTSYPLPSPVSPSADETVRVTPEFVLALHDFDPQHQNATCLSFRAGQVIHVLNRDPSGWWDGEINGRRGWFPSNYVGTDESISLLTEEELPHPIRPRLGHGHTMSAVSATSWATASSHNPRSLTPKDHRPLVTEALGPEINSYCPPLMVNLLHSLSLLQSAVRSSRVAHFQPSTACIISCVRYILSATECLPREAPLLKRYSTLAQERKLILSLLASLVAQAKKASDDTHDEESRDADIEAMLKLGGQVFSQVRRFLAVAVQCGIDIPERGPPKDKYLLYERTASNRHKPSVASVSSVSSSSSFSSAESTKQPVVPRFPSGPSTANEVMDALRYTRDQYLSTIAAFIGHAHSHTRSSHASSTGHMYDLVREIVELVCKLLTIVEAVMRHPDIPSNRIGSLKAAKEGLYNVTSSLAESVRLLTVALPPDVTEEEEKLELLRSATGALKAGADCVSAVKMCLNRNFGDKPFIIQIPVGSESDPASFTPSKFSKRHLSKSSSIKRLHTLHDSGEEDPDRTIQIHATPMETPRKAPKVRDPSPEHSDVSSGSKSSLASRETLFTSPEDMKPELSAVSEHIDDEKDSLPSTPAIPMEHGGSAWGSSQQDQQSVTTFEDKLVNGELPSHPRDPMGHDYPAEDVVYNNDGHLVAASLEVLVEKMTPHDSIVDPAFAAVFFLTFRLFASPVELVEALIARYNIMPPANLSDEDSIFWQRHKGIPIRLRVSNFVKTWLEMYWRSGIDDSALKELAAFTRDALMNYSPTPSQRILDLILLRENTPESAISPKNERVRDPGMSINPPSFSPSEIPRPTMTKALLGALRTRNFSSVSITDFDALELARQLTLMECNLYCAIQPEEVLEMGQQGAKPPVNVKAVSSLSTVITGWVAENILNEHDIKKRTLLVKFFIKVADRCTYLHNFSTPRSILAALDSSTISRLHQTWLNVPQKNKAQLDMLRRLADHGRNYHEYRSKLRNTAPPAVPFLGLYLTDVTFCREGNPSLRESPYVPGKKLLNFNKYHKLARIVQDMQRFQVPYNLKEIPEVQEYLSIAFENSKHHGDLQDLYRRSLLVEPKQPADTPPVSDMRQLFNWATRSQAQQPTTSA
ncbi:hypothetical protein SERLA73DRAFT_169303 [Serpula lacrymans var. lacrymans S7.3]|uniref:Ras GEF n=2 Tax=Serpula lacrymans var. lacrymans TaxID=341189 RepID=F8PZI4_SERL3|nr:uncharacterized protein SERLADRAFT_450172 [Serpula lacrymans var. lacrymans S7.9]EGN98306.1 hypothetical protein SERLA73DRAFT_169303 [Serpula lacrymans var. lacrymans S7.3]EGO23873.1 hypothetical protein SERLADRAFT_450172 [Serpula lacrymans var. lacrymans S7.9]